MIQEIFLRILSNLSLPRVKRDDVSSKICVELIFVERIDFASSYLYTRQLRKLAKFQFDSANYTIWLEKQNEA